MCRLYSKTFSHNDCVFRRIVHRFFGTVTSDFDIGGVLVVSSVIIPCQIRSIIQARYNYTRRQPSHSCVYFVLLCRPFVCLSLFFCLIYPAPIERQSVIRLKNENVLRVVSQNNIITLKLLYKIAKIWLQGWSRCNDNEVRFRCDIQIILIFDHRNYFALNNPEANKAWPYLDTEGIYYYRIIHLIITIAL